MLTDLRVVFFCVFFCLFFFSWLVEEEVFKSDVMVTMGNRGLMGIRGLTGM